MRCGCAGRGKPPTLHLCLFQRRVNFIRGRCITNLTSPSVEASCLHRLQQRRGLPVEHDGATTVRMVEICPRLEQGRDRHAWKRDTQLGLSSRVLAMFVSTAGGKA